MIFLNLMLPQFLLEYMIISYVMVSIIEGIILNLGTRKNILARQGILLGAKMNLASTIAGLFFGLTIAENEPIATIFGAYLSSVIVECIIASFVVSNKSEIKRIYLLILLGNIITYILIWFTLPWMF